jgi:hypothetical protein
MLISPRKALNKAFLKVKPHRSEVEQFKLQLRTLLQRLDASESEEFHKNLLSDFLKDTYYKKEHFINTKSRYDLVIHNGKQASSSVGVIMEVKRPENSTEMLSPEALNRKALHELLLYYLRERITGQNLELKQLVVTNINEWFIFDARLFEQLFARNKELVGLFKSFESEQLSNSSTQFFYHEIARRFIDAALPELEFTYLNLQRYKRHLKDGNRNDDQQLIPPLKLLSPEHLLKLAFKNDSNSLDEGFYRELLHIIGLKEVKKKGKKLIQRNEAGNRHSGSLMEDTLIQLDSLDKLDRITRPERFGNSRAERLYNVALELCITWVNRVLFLKLLEAQLLSYHRGDAAYAFLNPARIHNYDELDGLFFRVLAKQHEQRHEDDKEAFARVPYLNSSLFEVTELEQETLVISNLSAEKRLPIHPQTVLKDPQGKRQTGELRTVEYLFHFLNAYDFSSEGSEEIQEENKALINASVLGLIFEKINGYKDGSFFTPGFITMYMCRETIRKRVLQKFNEVKCWNCGSLEEVYDAIEDRNEANRIVNSITICDPAVGSGHFLVSALNELIAVKNDLRILQDYEGRRLKEYQVEVVNDELIVTDEEGELFEYRPDSPESERVQKALFHEKQQLIENGLFGVDINPNSVKICRLRLWIELLKHAYYKNATELETLPNIDINIKCGNSLVRRFGMDADVRRALRKSKWTIESYRMAVSSYRNAQSKDEKKEMMRLINDIKSDFRSEITASDPKMKRLERLEGELYTLSTQQQLFEMSKKEKAAWNKKESRKLKAEIETIKANKIYENAFEWRFEFPEVLNDEGDFTGFDIVIGNPPYIRQEEFSALKPYLKETYQTYAGTADLFTYFVELSMMISRPEGDFCFIIPNKWMRANYGKALRDFVKQYKMECILDFGDLPVFEEATTYPCILQLTKTAAQPSFRAANIETLEFPAGLASYIEENHIEVLAEGLTAEGWTLTDRRVQQLLAKLRAKGTPLKEYVDGKIYRGVLTGLNEAFVIDAKTKARLIAEDARSAEIIKPFLAGRDIKRYEQPKANKYLIFTRRGIDIEKYPAALNYLLQFKEQLMPKPKDYTGKEWKGRKKGSYEWYEIQDTVAYYEEFEKPKIIIWLFCTS